MIAGTLIIVVIVLVLILISILHKKKVRFKISFFMTFIAFILLILGVSLVYWQDMLISDDLKKRDWPHIKGEVVDAKVVGIRAFHPQIKYIYKIEDKQYQTTTDLNTPSFGNRRSRRDTAQRIIAQYPIGEKWQ